MMNPIKEIVEWNKKAGLLDLPHNALKEDAYIIEEALEDHNLEFLATAFSVEADAKILSRAIMGNVGNEPLASLSRLDKACDKIVFAVGDMAKLGLNAQEITRALNIVMKANNQKLTAGKDSEGKQLKPDGFVPPEAELQKLLDEIGL